MLLTTKRSIPTKGSGDPGQLLKAVPAFPPVARKLLELVNQETSTIPEVAGIIRADAVFASEVLRLANSAVLELRYEVLSLMHAVTVLGMDRLRAMVITVAMRDFLTGARHDELLRRCWQHNFACALVSEWLSDFCWMDRSDGYTAGILHDLGQLALISLHSREYAEILASAGPETADLLEAERVSFGIDHCQAGGWMAEHWGIPSKLRSWCSGEELASASQDTMTLRDVVRLACTTADVLGFGLVESAAQNDEEADSVGAPALLEAGLPGDVWAKVEPRLGDLFERVPYKVNVFETEFLS